MKDDDILEAFYESTDGRTVDADVSSAVRSGIREFLQALPESKTVREVISALEAKW
ncbi:hypothetical protein [Acetobacter fallax]|uniref:Uncharacterized protein n=1 Tax=Acetobacter fallax TaxID=1737473 RepID=A0ABX0KFV3_9PROT|nr:hypothetical protein [Acetobacter fallax]NHO33300.1 hypothetical protein [Acetobacter fallax]NHO36921.1 hypothetical protein [Acetobacter fallax]